MTSKRLKKMMMADGIPRNTVEGVYRKTLAINRNTPNLIRLLSHEMAILLMIPEEILRRGFVPTTEQAERSGNLEQCKPDGPSDC